ncbi:hypothetical protein [Bradyrhizobium sp.]|uniref:hypothetical protein n=1 Tax=Bradyrhizobium sp. TaxID=376 RepID=UPI0007C97B5B|nr:hypothetical protein [Bradyrhizobium sp.]
MDRMVRRLWVLDSNSRPAVRPISVPLVPALLDGVRYMLPEDVPPPEIRDLRRLRREKAPRAPSMRTLVRWARRCDSAEQLGHRLRQRFERQQRRAGITGGPPLADAEDRRMLDRLLDDAMR